MNMNKVVIYGLMANLFSLPWRWPLVFGPPVVNAWGKTLMVSLQIINTKAKPKL